MTDGFLLQIVLEHLGQDAHSIHLGINLDSGLGVFDAFFASLCMILVSEVCSLTAWIHLITHFHTSYVRFYLAKWCFSFDLSDAYGAFESGFIQQPARFFCVGINS